MRKKTRWGRISTLIAVSSVLLMGCSAVSYDVQKTWEYAFKKNQDVVLTPAEIKEFPYTALYGRVAAGAQILIVLGYVDQTGAVEQLNWVTGSRESITTEQARVIRTSGLPINLLGVGDLAADPLRCIYKQGVVCATQWIRQIDFSGEEQAGTETVTSTFTVLGEEMLHLPAGVKKVTRVAEKGRFVFAQQAFTNEFWLAADGHVVKSKQQLLPNAKGIELTQVKWVGRDE